MASFFMSGISTGNVFINQRKIMNQAKQSNQAEKRDFRMHPDLLWSVIKSQAGTLSKAFLELVMNAVDAGSDKIEIVFDRNTFKVSDNGKGFTSRQEIEDFFETFGTPHKEGDATYGKFRMGRGQIFSFAKNTWQSSSFRMDVDIKTMGLEYDLHESQPMMQGCVIAGEFYDKMMPSDVVSLMQDMENMCQYVPIPVFCNGKLISVDLSSEKWSHEDDDAYMRLNAGMASLAVYNRGVLVCRYPSGQYGCGGVVVSKKQLEVNFARNDILVSQCQTWKRLTTVIKAYSGSVNKKSLVKNEAWREMMCAKLAGEDFDTLDEVWEFLDDASILTDITGKHYSIGKLARAVGMLSCKVLVKSDDSMQRGMEDKLHAEKFAIVIARKSLYRFRLKCDLSGVIDMAIKCLETYSARDIKLVEMNRLKSSISTVEALMKAHGVRNDMRVIDTGKLSDSEKTILSIIKSATPGSWVFYNAAGLDRTERKFRIVESQVVDTDTDGELIFMNRKFLTMNGGDPFNHFCDIATKLLHEYLHSKEDRAITHEHPAEFHEYFERCSAPFIGCFISRAISSYGKAVMDGSIKKMRKAEERAVNTLEIFDEGDIQKLEVEANSVVSPVAAGEPSYSF